MQDNVFLIILWIMDNQESKRVNNICILFSKNYVNGEFAKFRGLRAIVGLVSCHRAFVG